MPYCFNCGTEHEELDNFCQECGVELHKEELLAAAKEAKVKDLGLNIQLTLPNSVNVISPAVFGIILFCFLLPFISFSCRGGANFITLSGIQLVTGTSIELPELPDITSEQTQQQIQQQNVRRMPPNVFVFIAFVCGMCGVVLGFVKINSRSVISTIVGAIGFITLLIFKLNMDSNIMSESEGVVQTEYHVGYWISLLLCLFVSLYNLYYDKANKNYFEKLMYKWGEEK